MSESKHTPGPWTATISQTSEGGDFWSVYGADDISIVYITLRKRQELAANARLIAAAPELLEALEGLCAEVDEHELGNPDVLRTARAAIAKARADVREDV